MNNAQHTARVGLFFLLGLALIWVTFETLSDGKIFKDRGYTLVAGFESLKELKQGDDVRMAGVKIGSVEQTNLAPSGRRAEAVLRIDPKITIKSDATAAIVMAGLIGTNYVGIDLGSTTAAALKDGAEIQTRGTPDINAIMSELGNLGKNSKALSAASPVPSMATARPSASSRNSTKSSPIIPKRSLRRWPTSKRSPRSSTKAKAPSAA